MFLQFVFVVVVFVPCHDLSQLVLLQLCFVRLSFNLTYFPSMFSIPCVLSGASVVVFLYSAMPATCVGGVAPA